MPNPIWNVKAVEPLPEYKMLITFDNGEKRLYDAKRLLDKPICASLKEPSFFAKARVEYGTVVWSNEIDIAPEYLYEDSIPYLDTDRRV